MPESARTSKSSRRAARVVALILGAGLLLSSLDAAAARLGGGRASGLYRPQITRTAPVRPAPQSPRNPAGTQAQAGGAGTAAAPAAAPRRNAWLGPLAGLAAGLGLGALLSHFGLAPALGSWLMVLLLAVAGFALFRLFMNAQRPRPAAAAAGAAPWSARASASAAPGPGAFAQAPDAAASGGAMPASFDAEAFVERARELFLRLQKANDEGDLATLRDASTPELFEQFRRDLIRLGDGARGTEVLSLQAHMLEYVEHPLAELVSVRFSGLLREQPRADAAESFDEVWHFTRPTDRSTGWLLAGIQPMA
ncbi:MAG: Tim44 domain-containing protein [Betaproteobacteria bacterium]|nr:39S ribosomal protein L45 [Betaproteobacteria bacterium]MDE1955881.1 Tim44 domain-containing protein [Betaproteobacteria bacterium]MDE2153781.1 Tim44 domain-containing protein [Betaproteobacteria bacterium]